MKKGNGNGLRRLRVERPDLDDAQRRRRLKKLRQRPGSLREAALALDISESTLRAARAKWSEIDCAVEAWLAGAGSYEKVRAAYAEWSQVEKRVVALSTPRRGRSADQVIADDIRWENEHPKDVTAAAAAFAEQLKKKHRG